MIDDPRSRIAAAPNGPPGRGGRTAVSVRALLNRPDPALVSLALPRARPAPSSAKPLLELGPDECRWPFGDSPFVHCAAPFKRGPDTPAGRCYCDYHDLVRSHGSAVADAMWAKRVSPLATQGATNGKAQELSREETISPQGTD